MAVSPQAIKPVRIVIGGMKVYPGQEAETVDPQGAGPNRLAEKVRDAVLR